MTAVCSSKSSSDHGRSSHRSEVELVVHGNCCGKRNETACVSFDVGSIPIVIVM